MCSLEEWADSYKSASAFSSVLTPIVYVLIYPGEYKMLPTIEKAEKELQIAGELNSGPWIKHSLNVGIAARNVAKKISSLDENKAYIVGILHDIGRRVGIVNIPKHVYEGYKFCSEKDRMFGVGMKSNLRSTKP